MRALSIRQPFPWLIIRPDITDADERRKAIANDLIKCVENRTQEFSYRGQCLIHSPNTDDTELVRKGILATFGITIPELLPVGGIVGVTEIVSCVSSFPSAWFTGPFGLTLRNSRPLPFREMKGRLGIWETGLELKDFEG